MSKFFPFQIIGIDFFSHRIVQQRELLIFCLIKFLRTIVELDFVQRKRTVESLMVILLAFYLAVTLKQDRW